MKAKIKQQQRFPPGWQAQNRARQSHVQAVLRGWTTIFSRRGPAFTEWRRQASLVLAWLGGDPTLSGATRLLLGRKRQFLATVAVAHDAYDAPAVAAIRVALHKGQHDALGAVAVATARV